MASSQPQSLPNPKKRPSLSTNTTSIPTKRPRLSHPLRQASFPSSDATAFYSPIGPPSARSETGSIANSTFSTTSSTAPVKRGRGRPRKSTTLNDEDLRASQTRSSFNHDTSSQVDGRNRRGGARSMVSGTNNNAHLDDEEDPNEAADDINALLNSLEEADESSNHVEALAEEAATQRRDRLKLAFSSEQDARFEKWRSVSLNKGVVKKMVNQVVSQSVGEGPLLAVNYYAKWFAAEIIERARELQEKLAIAYDETRKEELEGKRKKHKALEEKLKDDEDKASDPTKNRLSEWDRRKLRMEVEAAQKDIEKYIPNPHRGGLLPDHLREALRRYRADGEAGGVGAEGQSHPLLGIHGCKTWSIGDGAVAKRLFR